MFKTYDEPESPSRAKQGGVFKIHYEESPFDDEPGSAIEGACLTYVYIYAYDDADDDDVDDDDDDEPKSPNDGACLNYSTRRTNKATTRKGQRRSKEHTRGKGQRGKRREQRYIVMPRMACFHEQRETGPGGHVPKTTRIANRTRKITKETQNN